MCGCKVDRELPEFFKIGAWILCTLADVASNTMSQQSGLSTIYWIESAVVVMPISRARWMFSESGFLPANTPHSSKSLFSTLKSRSIPMLPVPSIAIFFFVIEQLLKLRVFHFAVFVMPRKCPQFVQEEIQRYGKAQRSKACSPIRHLKHSQAKLKARR